MYSPIRSLCFNDDRQTFTIILPSQYRIFRCDPFGLIFSRECEDLSLESVATYDGYRFIALGGAPSPQNFNSKSVRVFDLQTGQLAFDHNFQDHVLSMGMGKDIIVVCMYTTVEVWRMSSNQLVYTINCGKNINAPLSISPESSAFILSGSADENIVIHRGAGNQLVSQSLSVTANTAVSLVKFSDDSKMFATCGFNDDYIYIWDFKTLSKIAILERTTKDDIILAIDFSPSGDFLASISKNGLLSIFDLRSPNSSKPTQPLCTETIASSLHIPRFTWLNSMLISLASLEGDYYKITFNSSSIEYEKTPFLKRTV